MVQHNNAHLTIAQLSAYVDKELAPEELALCEAHIQICQPCQAALADLRLTSTLLNGMPMVEVPRSFTLPTNMIVLPETPAASKAQTRQPERLGRVLRRTLRTLSTVAAVLGLKLLLRTRLNVTNTLVALKSRESQWLERYQRFTKRPTLNQSEKVVCGLPRG